MTPRLSLTLATEPDLPRLAPLADEACPPDLLREPLADRTLVMARRRGRMVAFGAVDLDTGEIVALQVRRGLRGRGVGRRVIAALERRAVRFGMLRLGVQAPLEAVPFFRACGYRPFDGASAEPDAGSGRRRLYLRRHFPRRQTRYGARIRELNRELGISGNYGRRHRLPLQEESAELADAGTDAFGRPARLAPAAAAAWRRMCEAAAANGVTLQIASAFRSVDYQAGIIARKRERGLSMDEILHASAAPGYSEHHTGCAVDVTTPGSEPLEESFEATAAHAWLQDHAAGVGFSLSYPRDNRHGIAYEPWHWRFRP
ncbi:MAG: D-alanyl-D-alanine carboxypeptidase family protein [Gammaproteobacteria bacterium]